MDISDTLAPNSDQLDAVDLLGGPRVFTIERVTRNNGEQPINVHLAGFPRVWRPGKSMRRVMAFCWGKDASVWAGRSVRLYCDGTVRFGNEVVGGTRISHLTHIDGPQSVPLLLGRNRSALFTVEPLTPADIVAELRAEWKTADPERRKVIESEVAALTQTPVGRDEPDPDALTPVEASAPPDQLPDPGELDDLDSSGGEHTDG